MDFATVEEEGEEFLLSLEVITLVVEYLVDAFVKDVDEVDEVVISPLPPTVPVNFEPELLLVVADFVS